MSANDFSVLVGLYLQSNYENEKKVVIGQYQPTLSFKTNI